MNGRAIWFIAAFVVYAVIDVGWNVSPIAVGMYENLYENSGHDVVLDQFGRDLADIGAGQVLALLLFFGLIAAANAHLAIAPAVAEGNLQRAMKNGFLLGCAAYATYIVPIYLVFPTMPDALVVIDVLIGGALSLITSTAVTYVALRRQRAG